MRKTMTFWCISLMWALQCQAAGFQSVQAPGPDGTPMLLAIWYPSDAPVRTREIGASTQEVAVDGALRGAGLPLVVMSHGTGGSAFSHVDTALALADAGFVVAAPMHPGDNHMDQRRAIEILERPRHIIAVVDYMLGAWDKRAAIAPGRIGMFGFSSGGFTALVNIGGVPDLSRVAPHCAAHPDDYACGLLAQHRDRLPRLEQAPATGLHDARIKAAVIAAPAIGFSFGKAGLRHVEVPVQLWRAERDVLLPHPWYAQAVRDALPREPDYHVVPEAGHFDFLTPCSDKLARLAPPICTSAPGFDRAAFHRHFNRDVVAFFSRTLPET